MRYRGTLLLLLPAMTAGLIAACSGETQLLNDPGSGAEAGETSSGGEGEPSGGSTAAGGSGGSGSGAGTSSGGSLGSSGGASGRAGSGTGNEAGKGDQGGGPAGSTSSGGSATGGGPTAGNATGGGPTAGTSSGGGAAVACNSSDGLGCGNDEFCIDNQSDGCFPDGTSKTECEGACAKHAERLLCAGLGGGVFACPEGFACPLDPENYQGTDPSYICVEWAPECAEDRDCSTGFRCLPGGPLSQCVPDLVSCAGPILCKPLELEECPPGFVRSTPDGCYGPCVPVDRCACSLDRDCQRTPASCDRKEGRCAEPAAPAPRCALPFDPGTCDGSIPMFAFVDGECSPVTYGGCEGNDNRFTVRAECESYCNGQRPNGQRPESICPEGTLPATICTGCGAGGGCISLAEVCAERCDDEDDCADAGLVGCFDGICTVSGCV